MAGGPGNQPSPMNLIQGYCEQKKKKKRKKKARTQREERTGILELQDERLTIIEGSSLNVYPKKSSRSPMHLWEDSLRGRDRLAASGGSSPRPMKLCSLRPPKADVHRKGITFSSQELSQTPQNKLQAMTSHCVKTINPYHPEETWFPLPSH
jgi:hypothetical protein